MRDLGMVALLLAAFSGAAGFVKACEALTRRGDAADARE